MVKITPLQILTKREKIPLIDIWKTLLDMSSKVSFCILSSIVNCKLENQKNPLIKDKFTG